MGEADLLLGDFHSHLVPGVDDGAADVDEAVMALREMAGAGIRRIVTTPHLRASLLASPRAAAEYLAMVDEAFHELATAPAARASGVTLDRGFEVNLDVPDPDLSDPRLRLGGTRFALVEWPWSGVPADSEAVLRRIRGAGWIPVIAHPERSRGLDADPTLPRRWKDSGAYLQLNHGSFAGRYGEKARERALRLVREGAADYLSSDHHPGPRATLWVAAARTVFRELHAEESFRTLAGTNPLRLMEDREPLPVEGAQT